MGIDEAACVKKRREGKRRRCLMGGEYKRGLCLFVFTRDLLHPIPLSLRHMHAHAGYDEAMVKLCNVAGVKI